MWNRDKCVGTEVESWFHHLSAVGASIAQSLNVSQILLFHLKVGKIKPVLKGGLEGYVS